MNNLLPLKVMDDILGKVSEDVTKDEFGPELEEFTSKMLTTMYAHQGVGLAAVQVGRLKRILVADLGHVAGIGYGRDSIAMINPKVLEASEETLSAKEGCLSYPGLEQKVDRAKSVLIEYWTPTGERKERFFEDFEARVIQHEMDHFEGVTLYSRAPRLKRKRYSKKLTVALNNIAAGLKRRAGR
jgi:peptide deformylase